MKSSIPATKQTLTSIVFIDAAVEDYQSLAKGVIAGTEVIILESNHDGITQITSALQGRTDIASVHIVSHGAPGCLYLGNSQLSLDTLQQYAPQLQSWFAKPLPQPLSYEERGAGTPPSLLGKGDGGLGSSLLLYGCHVAAGDAGEEFITRLEQLTGAAIAASAKATGSASQGGDWKLEVSTQPMSASVAFEFEALESYTGVLAIQRVSVSTGGVEGNSPSLTPSISGDGRYVVFDSAANNLVAGDTNGAFDIFLYDTLTNTTQRVSVGTGGTQGNGLSARPSISGDGRYVVFDSGASNLVAGDTNGANDVFVYDTQTNTTQRVSVGTGGIEANGNSAVASISGDGRYVAFQSGASNLVAGDTNGTPDIFVYDTQTNTIQRVSVDTGGIEANGISFNASISGDGRYVAFESIASNLVAGDTNGTQDIFVYDTQTNTTQRVSVGTGGIEANSSSQNASISGDGRYVAFESNASNLVAGDTNGTFDIFVYDTLTNTIQRVSEGAGGIQANGSSSNPSISADGSYVTFESVASNLVPGDTNGTRDIFRVELNPSAVNTPPTVVGQGIEDQIISINAAFSLNVSNNFTDVDGDTLAYSATGLPTGFSINANTGLLSGTISTPGIFSVNVTADDGNGGTVSDAFDLIVANNNGTAGDDIIYMSQLTNTDKDKVNGKGGNDRIIGTSADEFIGGAEGNDYLDGQGGNDKVLGSLGNDTLIGGLGNDDSVAAEGMTPSRVGEVAQGVPIKSTNLTAALEATSIFWEIVPQSFTTSVATMTTPKSSASNLRIGFSSREQLATTL